MTDTNVTSSGYLTQEGRIAYDMSTTRYALFAKKKVLRELDLRVSTAREQISRDEEYRVKLLEEVAHAQTLHERSLRIYTNSPWMDIQAKPKDAPEPEVVP